MQVSLQQEVCDAGRMRLLVFLAFATSLLAQRPGPKLTGEVTKVSEHVQAMWGFPVVVFVTGQTGVLAIDTGLGPANGKIVADTARRLAPAPAPRVTGSRGSRACRQQCPTS